MNKHPLTQDMNMYYNGCYIFREVNGNVEAMLVDGTSEDGDDTLMSGFNFHGYSFSQEYKLGRSTWTGDEMIQTRPVSGYYYLKGFGEDRKYVTITVNNRTQRKGIDPRLIRVHENDDERNITGINLVEMYMQSASFLSNSASRDINIKNQTVHWKGLYVGDLDFNAENGSVTMREGYEDLEVLVCQLLQSI